MEFNVNNGLFNKTKQIEPNTRLKTVVYMWPCLKTCPTVSLT